MAKSRSIGGIYASLSLRDQGFKSGLKNAQKALGQFGKAAMVGAGAGAVAGGTALAAGTKRTLSMVDDLNDVSNQTGIAVDDMMKLQQAYKMGGRAAEMTGKDIGKMQKSIVQANVDGGQNPFESLGIDAQELIRLDPADQFKQIGEAIMKISNPAERTAKAMEIFGKGGMGLTTVFDGLDDATVSLGKMPEIAAEFADRMGEANDLIGNLPLKSDQFFMGFTAGIVDMILPGLNDINEFDWTMVGKRLGDSLTSAVKEASIILNTLFDVVTGQDSLGAGGGNKYAEAQMALDLEDQVAQFNKDVEKANKKKADKLNEFHPEDFEIADSAFDKMVSAFDGLGKVDFESANNDFKMQERQVNSYQSRGLSLDANGKGRAVETTNSLLATIRDILKQRPQGIGNW